MAFRPRHELPITAPDGDGPWPSALQLPIQTRRIIDASQNFFDTTKNPDAAGDAVVDYYSSSIANFVGTQRRDYASGINQQQNRYLSLPGLAMRYENSHGSERLTLVAQPESAPIGGQLIRDLNLDGYIIFTLYDIKFPNIVNGKPGYPTSYDLYMNGYLIKQDFKIKQACQSFVVMFGLSALRCQSLIDKVANNPFKGDKAYPLLQDVLPPRPQLDGHDDLPAYTLFNFTTHDNPIYTDDDVTQFQAANPLKVNVTGGVQFQDPLKSPLKTKKGDSTNYLGVTLSHGLTQGTQDPIYYMFFAEFFTRKKVRAVAQSWNKNPGPKDTLICNDKPLYWGYKNITSYTELTPGQNAIGFDLFDETGGDDDLLSAAPLTGTANSRAHFGQSIPTDDDDNLLAYQKQIIQIEQAFEQNLLPQLQQAQQAQEAARKTYNDDELTLKQTKQALGDLDDQINTVKALIGEGVQVGVNTIALAALQAAVPTYQQNVSKADDKLRAGFSDLTMADDAFLAIASETPTLPEAPMIHGKAIDDFVWREVNVSGDDWTFGDWMKP